MPSQLVTTAQRGLLEVAQRGAGKAEAEPVAGARGDPPPAAVVLSDPT